MKLGLGRLSGVAAAVAACIALSSIAAQATPVLDPAQFYTTYDGTVSGSIINGPSISHPFHGLPTYSDSVSDSSNHGLDGHTDWSASTTNVYSPTPSLQVNAAVNGRGSSANARSSVAYWVTFQGPNGADDVDDLAVTLTSSGAVSKTLDGDGRASVVFHERGSGVFIVNNALTTFSSPTSASWTDTFTVNTALIYEVIMQVSAQVNDNGTASGMIDPVFHLPTGYSVVTSAFAVAATPIPAALPLFASALGGLGLIGWRRKRAS